MKYKVKFPSKILFKRFYSILETVSPKKFQDEIIEETLGLSSNPRPYGNPKIKPPLIVYSYVAQYRLRVGHYRVLYDIDDKKRIVWILASRKSNERTY